MDRQLAFEPPRGAKKWIEIVLICGAMILSLCPNILLAETEVRMKPELIHAFPLRQQGDRVVVQYPILLNSHSLLEGGTPLRAIYIPPTTQDPDVRKKKQKEDQGSTYVRAPWKPVEQDRMTPVQQAAYDRMTKTVWRNLGEFQAGLVHLTEEPRNRLVFERKTTDGTGKVEMEPFEAIEGMFLGQKDGKVQIFAIAEGSRAAAAGIQAGEIILAINDVELKEGSSTQDSHEALSLFQNSYNETKRDTAKRQIKLQLLSPDAEKSHVVVLNLPRSLQADWWSDPSVTQPATPVSKQGDSVTSPKSARQLIEQPTDSDLIK